MKASTLAAAMICCGDYRQHPAVGGAGCGHAHGDVSGWVLGRCLQTPPFSYRVDIVRNSEGRMYIGLSEDVAKWVANHNSGVSTWTKHRGPRELIWQIAPH
ncbi:hypothetical protein [Verrucomicrobium sp. BvORR034]|uniref:hypothetical protein n=1 Tax=Verrucomicrobium sp. BvORR034 TaxID=1396418 RepID=UPI00224103AB|nr:hypothetical protein [Verrucomicrobium sp. BvORR034]